MKRQARQEAKVMKAAAEGHKPRVEFVKQLHRKGRRVAVDTMTLNDLLDAERKGAGV